MKTFIENPAFRESPTELESSDFSGQALIHKGTLAVVFFASWCPFCRRFLPVLESAAKMNRIRWASVNISEDENVLWKTFNIDIVPTIVVFKDGKPILRKDGAPGLGLSEDAIKETIEQMKLLDREN